MIVARVVLLLYIPTLLFLTLYSFKGVDLSLPKTLLGIALDKVVHFLMFLPFPILSWFALSNRVKKRTGWRAILFLLLLGVLLATLTEHLQLLSHYRHFDFSDLVANYLAIVVGTIVVAIFYILKRDDRAGRL
ncbi:MAG: VanZ family protein [Bacteroidales bacterium]